MTVTAFAAWASLWLTGMIPIAAMDACGLFNPRSKWRDRVAFYWGWPIWSGPIGASLAVILYDPPASEQTPLRSDAASARTSQLSPPPVAREVVTHCPNGPTVEPVGHPGALEILADEHDLTGQIILMVPSMIMLEVLAFSRGLDFGLGEELNMEGGRTARFGTFRPSSLRPSYEAMA